MQDEYKINPEDLIVKPINNDKYLAKIGLHLAGAMYLHNRKNKKKAKQKLEEKAKQQPRHNPVIYNEDTEYVFNKYAIIDLADVLTGLQYFAVTQQAAPKELLKKAAQVIDMIAKSLGYEEEKNGTEA